MTLDTPTIPLASPSNYDGPVIIVRNEQHDVIGFHDSCSATRTHDGALVVYRYDTSSVVRWYSPSEWWRVDDRDHPPTIHHRDALAPPDRPL